MGKLAHEHQLPRYIGYSEIADATGMDKRQIQRLMAQGKFPRPDGIPTKENRWRLSVVNEWFALRNGEQMARLSELAVSDPSKLKPDELDDAFSNMASEWARRHDLSLPDGSYVSVNTPMTSEQNAAAQQAASEANERVASALFEALGKLDQVRGMVVMAGLVPSLLPIARHLCGDKADELLGVTEEERHKVAVALIEESFGRGEHERPA